MSYDVKFDYCLFSCRTYVYLCNYEQLLKKLALKAIKHDEKRTGVFLEKFSEKFFKEDEFSMAKRIYHYEPSKKCESINTKSLSKCKNSDYSLFWLDTKNICDIFKDKKLLVQVKDDLHNLVMSLNDNSRRLPKITTKNYKKIINSCIAFVDSSEFVGKGVVSHITSLKPIFKELKEKAVYYYRNKESSYYIFENLYKTFKRLKDLCDVYCVLKKVPLLAAFVSSMGAVTFCLVNEEKDFAKFPKEPFDSKKNNILVHNAIEASKSICGKVNQLAKCFSYLNINEYLGFKNYYPILEKRSYYFGCNDKNEFYNNFFKKIDDNIVNKTNAFKAVYLRFLSNNENRVEGDINPILFFDYLSLLVAYQHKYDPYTLWSIFDSKGDCKKESNGIIDYLNKTTEHLYYDDSFALLSVIDQVVNTERLTALSLRTSSDLVFSSHQIRIYSFWNFLCVCSSLSFGSSSLLIDNLVSSKITVDINKKPFKPRIICKVINLAYLNSRVHSITNHSNYNAKEITNIISDTIFDNIGLTRIETYLSNSIETNWRSGELINTQTYQRYGLYLSLASIFITILSYAWVSRVHDVGSSSFFPKDLFSDICNTPKVLLVFLVPCVIAVFFFVLNVIETLLINYKLKHIAYISGYKKKDRKCKKRLKY